MNMDQLQRKISRRDKDIPNRTLKECRDAGFDAGANGASVKNCHFSYFASQDKTRAWEEGNEAGKESRFESGGKQTMDEHA